MTADELKKLAEAATPGPWVQENGFLAGSNHDPVVAARLGLGLGADTGDGRRKANGDWIRAANPAAILQLLAINAELVESLIRLRKMCNPEMSHQESLMCKVIDSALAKAEGGKL